MKKIILMLLAFMPMAMMAQNAKFGHLDTQAIMQSMPEFIKARGEIEAEQKQYENELQEMYQKIQQAYQDNQQKLQKASQEKMMPISNKIQNAIKAVGKAGNYVYIMEVTAGIPYISETLSKDVSAEVKAELNKMK